MGADARTPDETERRRLRQKVLTSLREQGFETSGNGKPVSRLGRDQKSAIRALHARARASRIARSRPYLERQEPRLLEHFANGDEVDPTRLDPVLQEVHPGSWHELLFRYARLHWSIPISSGYGRRLRYLVVDQHNGKIIGIIGLGDPVFSLSCRDRWIGWDTETKKERLKLILDAFVLGAVPPYSKLLCGKLVAMLAGCSEVAERFCEKYRSRISYISGTPMTGDLALITTISALGRSSIYNRLRPSGRHQFISVGYTAGWGEFHLSDGVYFDLAAFADKYLRPTSKHERWGRGWRSRREIIRAVLPELGLSRDLIHHGVRREVFVVPLARNAKEYLRGEHTEADLWSMNRAQTLDWFRSRWFLRRARWDQSYRDFDRDSLRLWGRT